MKLKIGDKIRIKSYDWYIKNINTTGGMIRFSNNDVIFRDEMSVHCGKNAIIIGYVYGSDYQHGECEFEKQIVKGYRLDLNDDRTWTDNMIDNIKQIRKNKLEKINRGSR